MKRRIAVRSQNTVGRALPRRPIFRPTRVARDETGYSPNSWFIRVIRVKPTGLKNTKNYQTNPFRDLEYYYNHNDLSPSRTKPPGKTNPFRRTGFQPVAPKSNKGGPVSIFPLSALISVHSPRRSPTKAGLRLKNYEN